MASLTRAAASKRVRENKPVFASYYNEYTREQCNVEVTGILDRGYGNYSICSVAADGWNHVSHPMSWDRISFSTKPFKV